jgi:hypothetical protein
MIPTNCSLILQKGVIGSMRMPLSNGVQPNQHFMHARRTDLRIGSVDSTGHFVDSIFGVFVTRPPMKRGVTKEYAGVLEQGACRVDKKSGLLELMKWAIFASGKVKPP